MALACAFVCATLALIAQQAPPPQPVFRGGVDVVQLDVLVLDRQRRPIRGLTAADFTVRERGTPQPIVAVSEVDVPDPVEPPAVWMRDVGPDVTSNDLQTRRLIILVLDDGMTGVDVGEPRLTRQVARSVIEHLGPADLAAVVFTFSGRYQNFTADRAQLLKAIDSFTPRNWGSAGPPLGCQLRQGGCTVNALFQIGEVLRTAPPGRKAIMYVGPALTFDTSPTTLNGPTVLDRIRDMFQSLQQANVSVYSFDPRGTQAPVVNSSQVALAESTGGRSIEYTNNPARFVPEVFRENSSYYLIGYRVTDPARDGRFRNVEVEVHRNDVEVRARNGYYARKPSTAKPSSASPLETAIARGLPSGDLPIRVSTAAFGVTGRREADVVVVTAVQEPADSEDRSRAGRADALVVRRVETVATAFATSWRSRGAHRQTVELTMRPGVRADADYEVISRLRLAPGRYEVRFGAERAGRAGSVFVSIDVPDFSKAPLSLSGVLIERSPALLIAPRDALAGLAPVVPTTVREFTASDRVTSFLRVYQGASRAPSDVSVVSTIVGEAGRTLVEHRAGLDAGRFTPTRSADFRWDLPLTGLPAGDYLLRIDATTAGRSERRDVRFRVN